MACCSPLLLLLLLLLLAAANGQIPAECSRNASAGGSGICCPIPAESQLPCGGISRGICAPLTAAAAAASDAAAWLPGIKLRFVCVCQTRRWGADCGDCLFGWEGPVCNRRSKLRIRRNIFSFSRARQRQFVQLLLLLNRTPSGHSLPMPDTAGARVFREVSVYRLLQFANSAAASGSSNCSSANSEGPAFFTWHRYVLLLAESKLQQLAEKLFNWPDFAMPYWEWTDARWCEVCVDELLGGPGECVGGSRRLSRFSKFSSWRNSCDPAAAAAAAAGNCSCSDGQLLPLRRNFAAARFPTAGEVNRVLRQPIFFQQSGDSFGHLAETSLHRGVVASVGGALGHGRSEASDPLFLLHYSQLDRLLEAWHQREFPSILELPAAHGKPGHSRDDPLVAVFPPVANSQLLCSSESLGYAYDSLSFGRGWRPNAGGRWRPQPRRAHFVSCGADHWPANDGHVTQGAATADAGSGWVEAIDSVQKPGQM